MSELFVPMDRMGTLGFQTEPMAVLKLINDLIREEIFVHRVGKQRRLTCAEFAESHIFEPGGFCLPAGAELEERLAVNEVKFYRILEAASCGAPLRPRKIALYAGHGTEDFCIKPLQELLTLAGFDYETVDDADIRFGLLPGFDIFLVPGGPDAGESFYSYLGDKGYEQIKEFVAENGHYFGICAGAYLALTPYHKNNHYWLGLVNATDGSGLDYTRTGAGFVRLNINNSEHPCFFGMTAGERSTAEIVYWEGPAFQALDSSVRLLATFDSFVASGAPNDRPHWNLRDNEMPRQAIESWENVLTRERFDTYLKGRGAVIEGDFHQHKVLLYSPHAEFGSTGSTERKLSQVFQMVTNGLYYLS